MSDKEYLHWRNEQNYQNQIKRTQKLHVSKIYLQVIVLI